MASNDFELSNIYNNIFVLAAINTFNDLADKRESTEKDFREGLRKNTGDKTGYFWRFEEELIKKYQMLVRKNESGTISLRSMKKMRIPFTTAEKVYIKMILRSKYGRIFFDEDDIAEMLERYSEVPDVPVEDICVTHRKDREITDSMISCMRLILKAIAERKEIVFSNSTRSKEWKDVHGFPVRIEYSVVHDLFQLSLWLTEESRPVKVNIHSMYDVEVSGKRWEKALSPAEMMRSKKAPEPIIMEVRKDRNTAERANILFSMYDTETEILPDGNYRIKLYYYSFDENEILGHIFSFGPYIRVVSPQRAVERIRERLEKLTSGK